MKWRHKVELKLLRWLSDRAAARAGEIVAMYRPSVSAPPGPLFDSPEARLRAHGK